ncbi:hypothetical protein TPB0596_11540 [Tsukamurella pulmonis]|uniref:hypothetical protein n=1 Tax=Tsukamurella pulmonis TaxID=47312 RepID=UPI001EDF0F27|nr:hypothetical protein [Tsukamurella pulmonis]BDD81391.1 hypothetical protein TPB0596_11540 [Tsukamurella pulmonis]
MRISSFGASVGSGPVHCVLLDIEDGHVVGSQARTIDPGPYRLGRRGNLLSSGFDLLASHAEGAVDASAVTVRTRRDLLSVRLGARGEVRSAAIVRDAEAALRGLSERGTIARYASALVADLTPEGTRLYTVRDGALAAEQRTHAVVGGHGGADAEHLAALVRSAVAGSPAPEAIAFIGPGAQNPVVREAVSAIARDAGIESVPVDEPEMVAATGAALLAADRRVAGVVPSSGVNSGIGVLGGHSVRLTAAILPLFVVAALTGAVLATGYATGIIGPASRSTEEVVPTSSDTLTSASPTSEEETTTTTSAVTSTLPPETSVVPTAVPREPVPGGEVTPTMTTFAPVPPPTTTRPPLPPTTSPSPTSPTGTLPTTILPSIPTVPPSESTPVRPSEGTATPSPTAESPRPGPGNGLVLPPQGATAPGSGTTSSNRVNTGAAQSDQESVGVLPEEAEAPAAPEPTVTAPAL